MTARNKARILMAGSLLLLIVSGGYAVLSMRKVARLRDLQAATQLALQDAYRMMVESSNLLHSTESILRPFQDWKVTLRRNADNLEALTVHPGLRLLAGELSDRAGQVFRVWKAMETSNFDPVVESLTGVLENAATELGAQGVSAGRALALTDERLLAAYYLSMVRAEKGLSTGMDAFGPFVTNVLDSFGQQISRQTDVELLQTTRVSAVAIAVLIVSVVGALLYSITFLDQANRSLETVVRQRTRAIRSLLDFSGRGFLSFGPDGIIRPEHSRECEAILGKGIAGKRLADLLYPQGASRRDFVSSMELVFSGKSRADVVFDLIDKEVKIKDKVVQLDFRVIDAETLMCSLDDITERRKLEGTIAEQQELREMVLRIAMNRRSFVSLTREAEEVFSEVQVAVLAGSADEGIDSDAALRSLHTFKANAAFMRMKGTADAAHALEQNLQDRLLVVDAADAKAGLDALVQAYRAEVDVVRHQLGDEWIREPDTVTVRREQLLEAERLARTAHPDDAALHAALASTRMIPIGDLLDRYNETVQNLAGSRAKRVKPIKVIGGDTLVLPEQFDRLGGCLMHLLRNMVDHGIERAADRTSAGKEPDGQITIAAKQNSGSLELTLSDDGRGISFEAVEAKARLLGLLKNGDAADRQQLLRILFRPGFSTAETVTAVSGRGVGLAAVSDAIRELGGRMGVATRKGLGTTFSLIIPHERRGRGIA